MRACGLAVLHHVKDAGTQAHMRTSCACARILHAKTRTTHTRASPRTCTSPHLLRMLSGATLSAHSMAARFTSAAATAPSSVPTRLTPPVMPSAAAAAATAGSGAGAAAPAAGAAAAGGAAPGGAGPGAGAAVAGGAGAADAAAAAAGAGVEGAAPPAAAAAPPAPLAPSAAAALAPSGAPASAAGAAPGAGGGGRPSSWRSSVARPVRWAGSGRATGVGGARAGLHQCTHCTLLRTAPAPFLV